MRILIASGIYPPEIGGPASFVKSLAGELVRRGDVVTVVTYGDAQTERSEVFLVRVVPRAGGPLIRYFRYALAVWRAAKSADVVFVQGGVSEGFPGMVAARLVGKPTVLRVPGDYAWESYQQRPGATELLDEFVSHRHWGIIGILERLERWTASHARRVIVPSRYLKRIVMRWGVPEDRIAVIYNSVQPLPFSGSRDACRIEFGVLDNTVILTAVRALPWKGGDFLIDVLTSLPSSHLLVIAGDGPCLEDWKRLAQERGVQERVRFLGRISRGQLARWYEAADLFALATGYEGYPHVVAEAVSAGLPCIVSDQGGNPETKEHYPQNVTIVPYQNRAIWVERLAAPATRLPPVRLLPFSDVVDQVRHVLSYETL